MNKPKSLKVICGGFYCGKGIKFVDRKTLGIEGGAIPTPTSADEGKVLGIKNGHLAFVEYQPPVPVGNGFYLKNMTVRPSISVQLKTSNGVAPYINLEKSEDGVTWTPVSIGSGSTAASLTVKDKLYLRGNNPNGIYSPTDDITRTYKFTCSYDYGAYGDVTSLITPDGELDTLPDRAFKYLFYNSTTLKHAPELPSTTLGKNCYDQMFFGCAGLTTAPELPATIVPEKAYSSMFRGSGLTSMPDLSHVTTVGKGGFSSMFARCASLNPNGNELNGITSMDINALTSMFENCTSLTNAPFPTSATSIPEECCKYMFQSCTALVTPPELPAMTVGKNGYSTMFQRCTSLATAPDLPATTLSADCYCVMFQDCTSLTHGANMAYVENVPNDAYGSMYENCSALLDAPDLLAVTVQDYAYYRMFKGCSSLVTAPEIKATTFGGSTLRETFMNCTNLNSVKIHFTDWSHVAINGKWLYGTSATGTFYCPPELDTEYIRDTDHVPVGWTVVRI